MHENIQNKIEQKYSRKITTTTTTIADTQNIQLSKINQKPAHQEKDSYNSANQPKLVYGSDREYKNVGDGKSASKSKQRMGPNDRRYLGLVLTPINCPEQLTPGKQKLETLFNWKQESQLVSSHQHKQKYGSQQKTKEKEKCKQTNSNTNGSADVSVNLNTIMNESVRRRQGMRINRIIDNGIKFQPVVQNPVLMMTSTKLEYKSLSPRITNNYFLKSKSKFSQKYNQKYNNSANTNDDQGINHNIVGVLANKNNQINLVSNLLGTNIMNSQFRNQNKGGYIDKQKQKQKNRKKCISECLLTIQNEYQHASLNKFKCQSFYFNKATHNRQGKGGYTNLNSENNAYNRTSTDINKIMDINKYVKFLDDNNRNLSTHVVDTKTKANTTASAYMNSNKKSSNAINNVIRIAKLREVYDQIEQYELKNKNKAKCAQNGRQWSYIHRLENIKNRRSKIISRQVYNNLSVLCRKVTLQQEQKLLSNNQMRSKYDKNWKFKSLGNAQNRQIEDEFTDNKINNNKCKLKITKGRKNRSISHGKVVRYGNDDKFKLNTENSEGGIMITNTQYQQKQQDKNKKKDSIIIEECVIDGWENEINQHQYQHIQACKDKYIKEDNKRIRTMQKEKEKIKKEQQKSANKQIHEPNQNQKQKGKFQQQANGHPKQKQHDKTDGHRGQKILKSKLKIKGKIRANINDLCRCKTQDSNQLQMYIQKYTKQQGTNNHSNGEDGLKSGIKLGKCRDMKSNSISNIKLGNKQSSITSNRIKGTKSKDIVSLKKNNIVQHNMSSKDIRSIEEELNIDKTDTVLKMHEKVGKFSQIC